MNKKAKNKKQAKSKPPARAISKPPTPRKAEKVARRNMGEELDELRDQVETLQGENEELNKANEWLRNRVAELEASPKNGEANQAGQRWKRGKLPGEVYIKTDLDTGAFEKIDKAEWDQLS